ncbi:MAG TPA: type II toxin-antitoxin system HicA family toxin [Methanospirillum sp.]|jgi:predicted RNA binding protein YcfA (HicA-like mRNA interferase family)|uniref:type II toxin-antitoxin system HicA family toxin n=1 Tax=Methanospirillum sp. TaxID=45200 RepID=UPI0009C4571E|nr:type II toxin-antitoxin system HicA family toxin [Methanospirillum sp.]OQB36704.1 MAG: YcfA-like protein [Euryarchaeota archaeon ADurb.Bin165]HPY59941.1 type II toxin-antitoxin system HicA family toxin [Methanospirillum sp.]HQB99310.1 type II toxin-antitoxin system HicA family toxin [Methanospirillum sp.]
MQGLPVVSGKKLIKALQKIGYNAIRQKGSHIQMRLETEQGVHTITIPLHDEIAPGTLNDIIGRVSLWTGISKRVLIERLKKG